MQANVVGTQGDIAPTRPEIRLDSTDRSCEDSAARGVSTYDGGQVWLSYGIETR
jgi:hypothetical protein